MAYAVTDPRDRPRADPDTSDANLVIVRRWRTGKQVASVRFPGGIASLDLSPSGALGVGEPRGGVVELRPGHPRRLARNGPPPWATDDCLLVAGVHAPATTASAAGACPRTQIILGEGVAQHQRSTLRSRGVVPVVLDCVAAAAPGCHGTLRLTSRLGAAEPLRFTVPAGARRRLLARLTPSAQAALRRGRCCPGLTIVAAVNDPDGRRSEYRGSLSLHLPRAR
jgi:hypothetical protein